MNTGADGWAQRGSIYGAGQGGAARVGRCAIIQEEAVAALGLHCFNQALEVLLATYLTWFALIATSNLRVFNLHGPAPRRWVAAVGQRLRLLDPGGWVG